MNAVSGAAFRGDLLTYVEEAARVDELPIGTQVYPVYGVDLQTGTYPKFQIATGELLNDDQTIRSPGGTYGRVARKYTSDSYSCLDRGIEELVDDEQKRNMARFFATEVIAAKLCLRSVVIGHERRVAASLMNTGNFTATAALVAYTAANLATINFVGDVLNAIDRLIAKGVIANTIVLSSALYTRVRQTTLLQNYLRGNRPSDSQQMIKKEDIAAAFGLKQVLVGRMPYNSGKKGAAATLTQIWGNTYFWVGAVESGDPYAGGAGRTFVWNAEGGIWVTEGYRDEQRRSDVIRVRQNTTEKVIDGTSGELVTTSYA
jgi:hypothetical protein